VALNLASPSGAQQLYTENEPDYYFIPPYVGPKGWLGVELNSDLDWVTISNRVREAWDNVAPRSLAGALVDTPRIEPPDVPMRPEDINPFLRPRAAAVLGQLGERCDRLPETSQTTQFGNPTWKAGKKTFVTTHYRNGRLHLQFWVGGEQQSMLTLDKRYRVPAYMGHNGWIELDVEEHLDWEEVEALLRGSYCHFALKRMLKQLD
jgi:predicted DNA-binding protein (MmcQ/YjbR family)